MPGFAPLSRQPQMVVTFLSRAVPKRYQAARRKPFPRSGRSRDRGTSRMKRRLLLREPIGVALETLRSHKMRSFLMLLGIILSVSTLIVVIALISGVNRYIADR